VANETLNSYFLNRWVCETHGYFEVGSATPARAVKCPECDKPAKKRVGENCTGKTVRDLPFVTKPRPVATADTQFTFSEKATCVQKIRRHRVA
jgi:hypothetical protein